MRPVAGLHGRLGNVRFVYPNMVIIQLQVNPTEILYPC